MRFVHLHTHSHYSLLDGLSKVDALVRRAKEHGMDAMAITDHGVLYGAIEFYKKATKAGVKPIIGCEMYITDGSRHDKRPGIDADKRWHLILLAENETGYRNLVKLVTAAHLEGFYYKPRIDKELLRANHDGLIALSSCLGGEVSQALLSGNVEKAKQIATEYRAIMGAGNYFIELQQHTNMPEQNEMTPKLVALARELGIPLVATQDSHYCTAEDARAHDILLAVQTGNTIHDEKRFTMNQDDFSFCSGESMHEKFAPLPADVVEEAFANTGAIADRCNLTLELGKLQLPHFPLPEGHEDPFEYLRTLAYQGLERRFGATPDPSVRERLEYELGVIRETGFSGYFLIVQDFVNWAKGQGIFVGPGRGSAAGSLLSYLLNITNVDPLKYNLLFERFLNPARISMPDIDLDFADARRGEVLKYVADKYGHDHVAQIITFGTMAARGSIRDAGRALGYTYEFCDRVAKAIPGGPVPDYPGKRDGKSFLEHCAETIDEVKSMYQSDPQVKALIDAASKLEGVARHASTHACAVVITPKPLTEYVPLQQGTHENDIITQYEMHAVEDLGLLKMDFLGLANLTIIEDTLTMVKENHGIDINIDAIPLDDAKTFKLLQTAQTTGVFQLESSGMKRYLKELKPTDVEDIIAMVALYRPGPMDLIPDYVERKHGRARVEYLHPALEPIMKTTYGVMVYQEQLMAAVRALAGFSLAEADVMRKAVGKKIKSLLDEQEGKFKDGCAKSGTPKVVADKFWELVEPFNRYAFNRSHAACYAMVAYQTAYLKANYPSEFMAAFMNSETGDIERIAFLVDEARQMGIQVLPPDVNESFERFTVVTASQEGAPPAPALRFGLTAVKNVGLAIVTAIINERRANGPFASIEDLIARVQHKDMTRKALETLAKCGACDHFGERNTLIANIDTLIVHAREKQKHSTMGQVSLFGEALEAELPPVKLTPASEPASKADRLRWEKELIGLYVSEHPLSDYQARLTLERTTPIKDLRPIPGQQAKIAGLVVSNHKIITKTGKQMLFSTIEDLTAKIEVVVFPSVLEKTPNAWAANTVVVLQGKLDNRDGNLKLLCDTAKPIAIVA
ncbi:MAG: DNA polymerase III subunit alpha [Candidatus Yanofskybacteria bacterium]|nr:DNA polymerase III subunit alpha [Candidatus Yanofskybacteria bacterium]